MLLYYITDRTQFPGGEDERRKQVLDRIAAAARLGVDFIQLREKDLPGRDLESLAREAVQRIRSAQSNTRLIINSRTDVAITAGTDGVHLRASDVSPNVVRVVWHEARPNTKPIVIVSSHTEAEVVRAKDSGANFVVFGPVFEKQSHDASLAVGTDRLRSACQYGIGVFALGGITVGNAAQCAEMGAKGIAGIRLFQESDLEVTLERLRAIASAPTSSH